MTTEQGAQEQSTEAQAEKIAAEDRDVRERMRDLITDLASGKLPRLSELGAEAERAAEGAARGVRSLAGDRREAVIGDVVDGLADGLTRAANATRLAAEEARARGESFMREDLERTTDDLRAMERLFTESTMRLVRRAGQESSDQLRDLTRHVERAAEGLRPAVESAVRAIREHPLQAAGETAAAGLEATRRVAGSFLDAVSGVLQGAGDALSRAERDRRREARREKDEE